MDSSQAPLISSNRHDDDAPYDAVDDVPEPRVVTGKATNGQPGVFVLILTFAAGISGLLFGCRSF
jgi:SP family myo-inositol transporter-like MFS transporter 13